MGLHPAVRLRRDVSDGRQLSDGVAVKYFRRVMDGIDVAALLAQAEAIPDPWPKDPYWLQHKKGSVLYAQDNLVLRYMLAPGHTRPVFYDLPAARKIVLDLMAALQGAVLGTVVISKLRPGESIVSHVDSWRHPVPQLYQRHQVPLRAAPGVVFRCGPERFNMTEEQYMEPGEAWWFNNQAWHEVVNDSAEDRISMFCDVAYL